ncbi:MAG: LysR substrate-binding domain-containing protein [Pigmentiphaga sp.]|uniref:LysR substrate-binding domain-containing protein n=1 Tax=Pigmentiphaga sp. TaxID=1977564 RepID=UPI0029A1129F|nr:LysR substrate-binding domain-containing protein [Pigmentiphaga sp.]MDX3908040.1 LysR substrate-binding domain-containing protein [Pigmentiphaga sp.]
MKTRPRLPPLNALRVFEAAARHLSFKKAAEELHVTAAAVSHQLSQLEAILGVQLFRRFNQGIELTPAARMCLPRLQEGMECLRESVEQIRIHARAQVLKVASSPSFSMRWLMPRLYRFALERPDIDVQVSTRVGPFDRRRGARAGVGAIHAWAAETDLLLLYGNGLYPGLHAERLFDVSITPLCSPKLLRRQPLKTPEDLACHCLLHDDRESLYGNKSFWQSWLEGAGVSGIDTTAGPRFTHAFMAISAALEGLGVVATTPVLALDELAKKSLLAPLPIVIDLQNAYHVVGNDKVEQREDILAFMAWLRREAADTATEVKKALPRKPRPSTAKKKPPR